MKTNEIFKTVVKVLIASLFMILSLIPGTVLYSFFIEYQKKQELAKQTPKVKVAS